MQVILSNDENEKWIKDEYHHPANMESLISLFDKICKRQEQIYKMRMEKSEDVNWEIPDMLLIIDELYHKNKYGSLRYYFEAESKMTQEDEEVRQFLICNRNYRCGLMSIVEQSTQAWEDQEGKRHYSKLLFKVSREAINYFDYIFFARNEDRMAIKNVYDMCRMGVDVKTNFAEFQEMYEKSTANMGDFLVLDRTKGQLFKFNSAKI
jgi:hypothetical protein